MDDPQPLGAALRRRRSKPTGGPDPSHPGPPERSGTQTQLLDAAERCLRAEGYAKFSTRRVAELAGMPLSQIHYHFGSKEGLVLGVLDYWNERLLQRQKRTFEEPLALWQRWERACDYLDEDLNSGYVRILQEMIAAGWSNPEIASAVRRDLRGWYALIEDLAKEAEQRFGSLGPFTPEEVACLVGNAFIGSEALILAGLEGPELPVRKALRKFGELIRQMEG
jgi:AcrR family transcriptional regulator